MTAINIVATAEADVVAIVKTIEADAVVAWDDFLKSITYLKAEAAALVAWAEKADPAIVQQLQDFLTLAETAAEALATRGGSALTNVIALGVDAAEQGAATVISNATGNSATGLTATALVSAGITDLGQIVSNMATVGYAKAVAAISKAAA